MKYLLLIIFNEIFCINVVTEKMNDKSMNLEKENFHMYESQLIKCIVEF